MAWNGTTKGPKSTIVTGTATITSFSHTVTPTTVPASVHDCASPGDAELSNCIWPSDYVTPGGFKYGGPATPVGLVCKVGVTVQTTGTATVGGA